MMAVNVSPGMVVDAATWDAIFGQHGRTVPNGPQPSNVSKKPTDEGYLPRDKQQPVYRYFLSDGTTIDARTSPDGDGWEIVDYKPSQAFVAAQRQQSAGTGTAQPPKEKDEGGRRWVWNPELNDGKGEWVDVGPAATSEADQVGRPTGNTRQATKDGTTVKETEYVLPDGRREWRTQTATGEADAQDQVGRPTGNTRQRSEGGQTVKEVEYVLPDGRKEWRSQTEAAPPAGRKEEPYTHPKTGKQYTRVTATDPATNSIRTYFVDPATGQEVTLDQGTNIKGVPPYTPDLTKPGAGIIERARQLDELHQAGTITWDQRNQVLEQDRVLAQTVANEFNVGVTLLREDYQNQVSQRNADVQTANTRASLSNQHMQNALGLVEKFLPYMGQTPGTATKLFTGMLAVQVAHATALGGLKDVPREQMHPNLRGYAERATAGAGGNAPAVPGATPPNALGLGAVGSLPAPGGPPAAAPAYDPNLFDRGPDGTPVPRAYTPASSTTQPPVGLGLGQAPLAVRQPEDDSWRQQADRRQVMMARQLLGGGDEQPFQLDPIPEATGMQFAPLPMVLDTQIPGLTPEIDMLAKRELDASLMGGGW